MASSAHAAACPPGNVWPNPSLEFSAGNGRPASWNQGGSDPSSLIWDTNTFSSPTHSLLVRDTNFNAYGEWYSDPLTLSATCDYTLAFKRRYSTTNGVMRLSANYYDGADVYLAGAHFVVFGNQTNWMDVTASLIPPKAAARLRLSLASGGALNVVGAIWADDLSLTARPASTNSVGHIARIDAMPVMPAPYALKDWRQVARDYDALAFNFNASGQFLPLIRWDRQRVNFALDGFWQPSYVGTTTHGGEAINSLAALLGATLTGIDKSAQNGTNFVLMALQYFNHANGQDLVLNNSSTVSGSSFWYEIQPHILFSALVDKYPATARLTVPFSSGSGGANMEGIMHSTALKWRDAARVMGGATNCAEFNWTAFNFATMQPVFNGGWREPDSAAGIAWLEYMAYAKFGETQFLQGATWGLEFLDRIDYNPFYETLLPYGAYLAARVNAELGRAYNVQRLLEWCFNGNSAARYGFGCMAQNWGGYDAHGLMGSVTDGNGYAFAMNTFQTAGALVPLARYDPRYARSLGKWMLQVANNARLFYANVLPANQQSSAFWTADTNQVVPYEGLRFEWNGQRPVAMGDPLFLAWGPQTDFALYGGSYVGMLGGLVAATSQSGILQLDLLATDYFHAPAHPTFLLYNPHPIAKQVVVSVGSSPVHLYDAVLGAFVASNVSGNASITLGPDSAAVLVLCPADGALTQSGAKLLLVGGRVIDYHLASLDSDHDGLPDWWESLYFANPTNALPSALAANGFSNQQSFLLGVSPIDPRATFMAQAALQPGTGYAHITWMGVAGKTYAVEYSDHFHSGTGAFQQAAMVHASGAPDGEPLIQQFTDDFTLTSQPPFPGERLYRLRLVTGP